MYEPCLTGIFLQKDQFFLIDSFKELDRTYFFYQLEAQIHRKVRL
jgi:hypothetical protein